MRAVADKTGLRRKNLILDQRKIDHAKEVLGAATETEAIHRALDETLDLARFRGETEDGLDDLLGRGGFTDHFAPSTGRSSLVGSLVAADPAVRLGLPPQRISARVHGLLQQCRSAPAR